MAKSTPTIDRKFSPYLLGNKVKVTYRQNEQETTLIGEFLKEEEGSVWITVGGETHTINVEDIISIVIVSKDEDKA